MSRGGLLVRGELLDAMAIWMTASMSSFVGPEPAGGVFDDDWPAAGGDSDELAFSLGVEEDEVGSW